MMKEALKELLVWGAIIAWALVALLVANAIAPHDTESGSLIAVVVWVGPLFVLYRLDELRRRRRKGGDGGK